MLDHEDLKWLAQHATELNRLLQQVARYSDQVRQHHENDAYFNLLDDRVERAARKSQELFDRVTSRILVTAGGSDLPNDFVRAPLAELATAATGPRHSSVLVKIPVGEIGVAEDGGDEPVIRNPKGARELILVVDDDEELLEGTSDILDFEDYRVLVARDGPEALRVYRRMARDVALVLLDYFLPVMDGDAVFDELKAINPDVRVVLISGFDEQARIGNMLARGLCAFLPKPYSHGKLVDQIRTILDA